MLDDAGPHLGIHMDMLKSVRAVCSRNVLFFYKDFNHSVQNSMGKSGKSTKFLKIVLAYY